MLDLRELQQAVLEWRTKVLKPAHIMDPVIIALKGGEEMGEVEGEVVREQEDRGDVAAVAKEIGDVVIVLCALCTAYDLDLETVIAERWLTVRERRPLERITRGED